MDNHNHSKAQIDNKAPLKILEKIDKVRKASDDLMKPPKPQINYLPSNQFCAFCSTRFTSKDPTTNLMCGHKFHKLCFEMD